MIEPVYHYRATLHRLIDADTYELNIDLGFKVHATLPVRLFGWDCPELSTEVGKAAAAAATEMLANQSLVIESYKGQQTFARWLARVWAGGVDVGERLAALGFATPRV